MDTHLRKNMTGERGSVRHKLEKRKMEPSKNNKTTTKEQSDNLVLAAREKCDKSKDKRRDGGGQDRHRSYSVSASLSISLATPFSCPPCPSSCVFSVGRTPLAIVRGVNLVMCHCTSWREHRHSETQACTMGGASENQKTMKRTRRDKQPFMVLASAPCRRGSVASPPLMRLGCLVSELAGPDERGGARGAVRARM
ncbi:hypothetical protein BDZ97DRAFT_1759361 [Flammula alnicola]|nr:hypothetical protein BDZ97DRAFT_1759361 [Flammula alnicola]